MKGGIRPLGYTIIEVMIFLAVSGLMFILAATFISGKQGAVEFKQGMSDANTQIRSVVNEVANGEYPSLSASSLSCYAPANSLLPPVIGSIVTGNAAQGANGGQSSGIGNTTGCIFLGKVMQFDVAGNRRNFNVYTIAARQTDASGLAVTTFNNAQPIAVSQLTDPRGLENGLEITKILVCTSTSVCTQIGAFGFFGSFGSYNATSGDLQSGAQSIITAPVPGSLYGDSVAGTIGQIKTGLASNMMTPIDNGSYILLCFQNGNQKGSVTIGGTGGQQFTTELNTGGAAAGC